MKQPETDLSKKPSLYAGRKNGGPGKNRRKQAWSGNQMHVSAGTGNRTCDLLVKSKGR